ncbi:hypothetical protein [Mycolicibacterium hodleri]|uniref:Uncharacterized protein n=1 Tax=Mycolicibacterium hodleri TaxID=49897 RepID=A0A502ED63_9MYCO|nr:hypothetical protein [Mycolicibacterium hodleri]TPG34949.1 hypothetical protein EAH80_09035 [Mycolicibacterium hodleri]
MDTDTSSPDEIASPEPLDDAQISEIVDQELAIAVADPDSVYVVVLQYRGDSYISVHTSRDGADARLRETAAQWGIEDVLIADELAHQITKVPVETP